MDAAIGSEDLQWLADHNDMHTVRPVRANDNRLLDVGGTGWSGDEIDCARDTSEFSADKRKRVLHATNHALCAKDRDMRVR